jgi:hypothetical protein
MQRQAGQQQQQWQTYGQEMLSQPYQLPLQRQPAVQHGGGGGRAAGFEVGFGPGFDAAGIGRLGRSTALHFSSSSSSSLGGTLRGPRCMLLPSSSGRVATAGHLLGMGSDSSSSSSFSRRGSRSVLPVLAQCTGSAAAAAAGGSCLQQLACLPVYRHWPQQQPVQHCADMYSQSSSYVTDLQRSRVPRSISQHISSRQHVRLDAASTSSRCGVGRGASRGGVGVVSGGVSWNPQPLRCSCSSTGSRCLCAVHMSLRVAGGTRMSAAAGVAAAALALKSQCREQPAGRRTHALRVV